MCHVAVKHVAIMKKSKANRNGGNGRHCWINLSPVRPFETYTEQPTRVSDKFGAALTAVCSKTPPLTARCLLPLTGFESLPGHVRKLPVTWSKAVVFAG